MTKNKVIMTTVLKKFVPCIAVLFSFFTIVGYANPLSRVEIMAAMPVADSKIEENIMLYLGRHPYLKHYSIAVAVTQGHVTLQGEVTTEQQYSDAIMLANAADGVQSVDASRLSIARSRDIGEQVGLLALIRGKLVSANVFSNANYIAWPIYITVDEGTVSISGTLKSVAKKRQVLSVIGAIPGVVSIEDDIETETLD